MQEGGTCQASANFVRRVAIATSVDVLERDWAKKYAPLPVHLSLIKSSGIGTA
jgi:hypothetical protein